MAQIPEYLAKEDELGISLPGLFESRGYKKYRMSKFEEYSFYSDNRNFMSDDGVIAFNNADGRLMALKPDITLSIVKNAKLSEKLTKLYYNESVFRMANATKDFKEIKQCGIEVLGDIDNYITAEVIMLATKSLEMIDENCYLSISHNGIVLSMIEELGLSAAKTKELAECIGGKNTHDFKRICHECMIPDDIADKMIALFCIDCPMKEAIEMISASVSGEKALEALQELKSICNAMTLCGIDNKIRIDLSVTQHIDYYTGIVFQGYVEKAPTAVLSGGRYDKLASKIRNGTGAIGFAVYLDNLNLFYKVKREFDTDILVINKDDSSSASLLNETMKFSREGRSVCVERSIPEQFKYREIYIFENGQLRRDKTC